LEYTRKTSFSSLPGVFAKLVYVPFTGEILKNFVYKKLSEITHPIVAMEDILKY
jgi:hypothetical protein